MKNDPNLTLTLDYELTESQLAALIKAQVPAKAKSFRILYEGKTKWVYQPIANLDVQYGVNCEVQVSAGLPNEDCFEALPLKLAGTKEEPPASTPPDHGSAADVLDGKTEGEIIPDLPGEALVKPAIKPIMKKKTKNATAPKKAAVVKKVAAASKPVAKKAVPTKKAKAKPEVKTKTVKSSKAKPSDAAKRKTTGFVEEIDKLLNLNKYTLSEATELLLRKYGDKEPKSVKQVAANRPNSRRYRGETNVPKWVPSAQGTGFSHRIDALFQEGGHTFAQVAAKVMKEFAGKEEESVKKVMRNRLVLLRRAGKKVDYVKVTGGHKPGVKTTSTAAPQKVSKKPNKKPTPVKGKAVKTSKSKPAPKKVAAKKRK